MKTRPRFETSDHKYTVIYKVGEGGPSVVFLVENEAGRRLALKHLKPEAQGDERTKRFRNEISFCEKSDHPNIIKVVDHGYFYDGVDRKILFYVMPYYENTLRDLLKNRITQTQVIPIYSNILAGVNAAHIQGHHHRDIKPENILVNSNGNAVVADFGIAHFHSEAMLTTVQTNPRARMANFKYAAPEQKEEGATVDHRADIYALGLILNELFTGKVPVAEGYVRISAVAPSLGYLDSVVAEMIQQDPEKRPKSIDAINALLRAREKEYFSQQRIDSLRRQVVPLRELGDEVTFDPPQVVGVDLDNHGFIFELDRNVNDEWIGQYNKIDDRNHGLYHAWPEQMEISGRFIRVNCSGEAKNLRQSGQALTDLVKKYVTMTNERYKNALKRRHEQEEANLVREANAARIRIEAQVRKEEERKRILGSITL